MLGLLQLKLWLNSHYEFLTEEDLDFFKPYLVEKTIERDGYLLTEGGCCRDMSFIVSGVFRMFYLSDGKEINAHFFLANDFMAEYCSFLNQKPSKYSIQALERSVVVTFSHEVLIEAYKRSKNWERLGRMMAEQFAGLVSDRMEKFLFMDGTERYLSLMQENPKIFDRVPLYHLASYLGMERESLSRIRNRISRS
ncbi:MAG: Crp/Fnr family transcriptional regulator [Chlorobiaceae bacterium]|jgi:CRP/FNR family transcriptional regulator, anaerobic regulatory protein|nr:Crp/Fnr family transcriptional regulator [Chlorobiaceae bacterium]